MALRVLLADESVTIKKVFQLALQDFAVEVVTVNVGVDVVQVATKIKPDIIFADVLLQKMSGYDVSHQIKSNPQLGQIPVVLIWSGFLDLDESRYQSSGADAHLEKPFDTQRLRKLIQSLVPKTNTQPMSPFLKFPPLPDFAEEAPAPSAAPSTPVEKPVAKPPLTPYPLPPTQPPDKDSWSMENFDNIESVEHTHIPPIPEDPQEDFVAVQLPNDPPMLRKPKLTAVEKNQNEDDRDGQWVQKTLTKFKLPAEKQEEDIPVVKYSVPEDKIHPADFLSNTRSGYAPPALPKKEHQQKVNQKVAQNLEQELEQEFELDLNDAKQVETKIDTTNLNINDKQIESIVRAQAKEIIEKVVWQIVPEIATRVIERELERLLKEQKEL